LRTLFGPRPISTGPLRALAAIALVSLAAGCAEVEGTLTTASTTPANTFAQIYGQEVDNGVTIPAVLPSRLDQRYVRREVMVPLNIPNEPGTIVVDTRNRYLYLIEANNKAMRYGIGVGRQGFAWSGEATIKVKRQWPKWIPPKEMVARDPAAAEWANGMPGGRLDNPLGARAMYLYQGNQDTLYRLHGTNDPRSIGKAISSGCVRLLNQDVIDLYNRVPIGTKVVVLGDGFRGSPFVDYLFPGNTASTAPASGSATEAASGAPTPPKAVGQI
jgi:lipoprotein-anchoring transpeptidase ErfK/SrfK